MLRKLILKIKRYFFYKSCGFYPEEIRRLTYVQKYLEYNNRKNKKYNDYLKEHFNAKQ